jgi:hypothetical protein
MLIIPTNPYRSGRHGITVDLPEPGTGGITLALDLEPGATIPTGPRSRLEVTPFDLTTVTRPASVITDDDDLNALNQARAAMRATEARAAHYYDEAERLSKALLTAWDRDTVDVELDPDAARALAAALWHYANEADR